jgi:periplasmic copper chaperone A
MSKMRCSMAAAVFAALVLSGISAHAQESGIRVDQVWARATPGIVKTGVIYLSVTNTGTTPDRLVAVSTPVAKEAELHEMKMANGVMQMRPLKSLAIAPGKTLVLHPDGYHIMLLGLKAPLKEGEKVPLTLTFEHAGKREVTAAVARVGAMHPGEMSKPGAAKTPTAPEMSTMPEMGH